ncbi:heparan-alpha-glucosaminide N-acetyltransferase [Roseovarius sp. EGI FJ00037]|uniref:heparan-alpha-glucosaminide N-acetyltransferase n=1 Tax=Roseovarius salincola TaxID=2978479 RepID=UPI0022A6A045|nr:heparan-alpha-glucosaminide N-acetyltransferase [Roseovarius sp. EGI FJ00037]MCZ0810932.1 heparan-alpha-glucosaminide N-acetyltransferase [Roseovarius sp. EGI FJ00037]
MTTTAGRMLLPDVLRAAALAGMVLFHFVYDLQFFGHLPPGTVHQPGWDALAHLVAGGFIFLAGASLYLAHARRIRWSAAGRRLAQIALAALLVSLATYAMMPDYFVYFGILHAIATFSLLGLAFLRLRLVVVGLVALGVFLLPRFVQDEAFAHPALWWLGLSLNPAPALDFEPLFPWFAVFLAGLISMRLAARLGWLGRAARYDPRAMQGACRWILWAGRNTLPLYLLHQPLLFALIWSYGLLV